MPSDLRPPKWRQNADLILPSAWSTVQATGQGKTVPFTEISLVVIDRKSSIIVLKVIYSSVDMRITGSPAHILSSLGEIPSPRSLKGVMLELGCCCGLLRLSWSAVAWRCCCAAASLLCFRQPIAPFRNPNSLRSFT